MENSKAPARYLPLDVSPRWLDLIRKVMAEAKSNNGNAIVHVNILMNEHGEPVIWTTPTVVKIEPRRSSDLIAQLLNELCVTD